MKILMESDISDLYERNDPEKEYSFVVRSRQIADKLYNEGGSHSSSFIYTNLSRILKYRRIICLDADNPVYKDLDYISKRKLKTIDDKITVCTSILADVSVSTERKLRSIMKLNRALLNFIHTYQLKKTGYRKIKLSKKVRN